MERNEQTRRRRRRRYTNINRKRLAVQFFKEKPCHYNRTNGPSIDAHKGEPIFFRPRDSRFFIYSRLIFHSIPFFLYIPCVISTWFSFYRDLFEGCLLNVRPTRLLKKKKANKNSGRKWGEDDKRQQRRTQSIRKVEGDKHGRPRDYFHYHHHHHYTHTHSTHTHTDRASLTAIKENTKNEA